MSRSLRVAHLTPTYFSDSSVVGGGERYVHNLVRALATADGFEQAVLSVGAGSSSHMQDGTALHILRNAAPEAGMMDAVPEGLTARLSDYDLVHIHQCLTGFGAYCTAVARSAGVATVGTDLGGGDDALMMRRGGIELLDRVVSISAFAQRLLAGAYTGPMDVLIGPVDTDAFTPAPGHARDPRMVLCVGRLLPHKGVDRIIAALPQGLRLVVVGRVYDERYHHLLLDMAEGKEVSFIADADDTRLVELYRSAAVLVQASTARDIFGNLIEKPELMGLTTLEAMACGLPVLGSDAGSLPELVPDPRFGRVFHTHDDLVALLAELRSERWPGPQAPAQARNHVVANHGMAAIGQKLAAAYRAAVAQPRWSR
jgi:glycosyltransferase involved in cell wall biosynthesis